MTRILPVLLAFAFAFAPGVEAATGDTTAQKPAKAKAVAKAKSKGKAKAKAKAGKPAAKAPVAASARTAASEQAAVKPPPTLDPNLHLPASEATLEREINAVRARQQDPSSKDHAQRLAQAAVTLVDRLLGVQAVGNAAKAERITAYLDTNLPDVGQGVLDLAGKGDAKAQQAVGVLHLRGIALPRDPAKACAAFKRAAETLPGAAWHSAQCVLEAAPEEAWATMERAALLGHAAAQEWMGRRCLGELGASGKDFDCARGWLSQSATQGRPRSQTLLGYLLNAGLGGPVDSSRAVRLYTLAAEQGDADAQNNLGEIFEAGRGVERSLEIALGWYERAAERGLPAGQFNAGRLLAVGVGDKVDPARARAMLVQAEAKGITQSRQVLDWLTRQESGTPAEAVAGKAPKPAERRQ